MAAMVIVLQRSWRSYICRSSNILRPQGMLLRGLIGSPRSRQWTGCFPTMYFRDAAFGAFVSIPFIQMGCSYAYMQVERWFHDSSSLCLPLGEFVPTLYNWLAILGISLGVGLEGEPTFTLGHPLQILQLGGHVVRAEKRMLITSVVCSSLDELWAPIVGSVGDA